MDLVCQDTQLNISKAYLKPGFAFGGSCLPKDVKALAAWGASRERSTPLLDAVLTVNHGQPRVMVDMVERALGGLRGRKAAVLGLAFKPGTDDLRESPFVTLAEKLLGRGYDLKIYDRHVQVARLLGANKTYIEREIPHLEQLMVVSPAAALGASRIAVIGHIPAEDRTELLENLRGHVVIDLVGMPELRERDDLTYEGLSG